MYGGVNTGGANFSNLSLKLTNQNDLQSRIYYVIKIEQSLMSDSKITFKSKLSVMAKIVTAFLIR